MVNFVVFDITLLILFTVCVSILLYVKRRNLGKEGSLILYRTKWGIKLIDYVGGKYKRTLKFLSYISVGLGYVLMVGILLLIIHSVYIYFTTPIAKVIKAPPVIPLIPYFPKLFGLQSIFPPFYFIYFILALVIVATVHEFSHGIFARRYGIKIKSTGFAFLKYFPALFGAFVEQDEKQMKQKNKFEQMSVLSAGVFANIIIGVLFFVILIWFFSLGFAPAGVAFDTYSYSVVGISSITYVNGISISDPSYEKVLSYMGEENLNKIKVDERNYVATKKFLESQEINEEKIVLYDDSPAINAELGRIIQEINNVKITNVEILKNELGRYSPGDRIKIKTIKKDVVSEEEIILGKNPENENLPWLGVGFFDKNQEGVFSKIYNLISGFKEENVYYEAKYESSVFVYNLLWWIIIINVLVAFFNMLPLGFLDGGRFFYLTIFGITGSKKTAERAFVGITYFLLFLLFVLMAKWIFTFL